MITRIIYTKMWKDRYYAGLTPIEKLLFFYFLTNEYVNIIHLYELSERVILFDTGVSSTDLEHTKNKFQADKKIHFYQDYVYLANAQKYETYTGQRNDDAKQKLFSQLPKDVLDWYYSIPNTPKIPLYIPPINHKSEIINNKSYKREDINIQEKDVVEDFDSYQRLEYTKTGKN